MQNIFAIFLISLLFVSCDGSECGIKKIKKSSLISGGKQSYPGEWPWLVSLHKSRLNKSEYFCGSSLINEKVLITAAHCIDETLNYDIFALLGRHNYNNEKETNWVKRNIIRRLKHEEYKDDLNKQPRSLSDIAILLMESPVVYTDFIQPICLPKVNENVFEVDGIVAGHGRSGHDQPPTEISKFVHMKSITLVKCLFSSEASLKIVSENSFCAAGPDGIPCFGDSGGGFISEVHGKWTILGVVSQTLDTDCTNGGLVVFVNLALYLDWIERKINELKKLPPSAFVFTPKINPCDYVNCGDHKNSYCDVVNSKAICKCSNGLNWSAGLCIKCVFDFDCQPGYQCRNTECVDFCQNFSCGPKNGARCKIENSKPICECKNGFKWSSGNCRECLENFDCSSTKICSNYKCIDPCTLTICGQNSKCSVVNRKTQCECLDDFELDYFGKCLKKTCKEKNCPKFSRCFEFYGKSECRCLDGMTLDHTKTKCQWTCDNGARKYEMSDRCDGHSHCSDKTDENLCAKGKIYENWQLSGCDSCPECAACTRYKTFLLYDETKIDSENFMISSGRDESVQRIRMSHNKLVKFLPLTVQDRFPNLIEYNFFKNSVKNVKKENFAGLKKLKIIFLEGNEIETVEENSFEDLRNLEKLWLHENQIASFPQKIFENLISLKDLSLSKNKLETLNENSFSNLRNLEELRLYENQIASLPPKIFQNLILLKELSLSKNKLETLSENSFSNLRNLEILWLHENQIASLPPKIFENLISLKELYLYKNKLETLSENLFSNLRNLEELRLYENQIASLPPKIFDDLSNLEFISIGPNKLKFLPEKLFKNNNKIQQIWTARNQLQKIDSNIFDGLIFLKFVNLYGNTCTSKWFGNSTNLYVLSIAEKNELKQELQKNCN